MVYGHTSPMHFTKDCPDQPLHHSYIICSMTLLFPSELGNESRVNLDSR